MAEILCVYLSVFGCNKTIVILLICQICSVGEFNDESSVQDKALISTLD